MSSPQPVPLTVKASYQNNDLQIVINSKAVKYPGSSTAFGLWYVVVNNQSLDVLASVVSNDADSVPSEIAKYENNTDAFLVVSSVGMMATMLPAGNLYTFLRNTGSGTALDHLEQLFEQLGTGSLGWASYALIATLDQSDAPGIEGSAMNESTILTATLMPVEIDGKTVYTPVPLR